MELRKFNGERDHVHLLVFHPPKVRLSELVNSLKGVSSRSGDTLLVPKFDRLARSVPDALAIGDALAARGVKLQLGASVRDPSDPMGKLFFNILATFAEFEADLRRDRRRAC